MLLVECRNLKKSYGDRLILDIENLRIYDQDRIGIVGVNGAGKTTLLNLLSQRIEPDEGWVKLYGKCSCISQLEPPEEETIQQEMASKFKVPPIYRESMSGGEKTRFKLATSLSKNNAIIFADEPTSNMDIEGIQLVEDSLAEFSGALVLISHDRDLLDSLCSKIIEIEDGKIKSYSGNYSEYIKQKTKERERAQFEYEEYVKEKKRLERVIISTREKVKSMRKTPRRMGNSEARLHKMGNQKAKANLDRAIKNMEARIQHLEVKEKPKKIGKIKLDIGDVQKIYSKVIIEGKGLNKSFGEKVIFKDAQFYLENGAKVALIGPNGCGKTTLLKMILNQESPIKIAPNVRIGYFSQELSILEENKSILDNVMSESVYEESFARILLARLLFKGDSVYKKVGILSGGERVKASFAKIICSDFNLLILDEPTNYLDLNSLEVVEEVLREYQHTLLFVSHDRRFINSVASQLMIIEDHKLKTFKGSYEEYMASRTEVRDRKKEQIEEEILRLETRLTELISKISMPSKKDDPELLEVEYRETLRQIRHLKNLLE
ncbi:ribosomal protection-like ABC-F family protein [Defluviitalea raffinosedens]|uniref:ribosomal protection-like ABC-F family protein n=1 Tax=Defluviitalea raffinosedens TaxID=1450156 RepID=UPI00195BEABA|nr:ABC-F type ribosomal protection protein [Defluviitalea raffinosedens]MBM7687207.1 macrolide transport system ATP-binding/permease protein [Defluviitalea raffinosedens]